MITYLRFLGMAWGEWVARRLFAKERQRAAKEREDQVYYYHDTKN